MVQYTKAEYFYLLALEQYSVKNNMRIIDSIYNDRGTIYNEMNQRDKAYEYYEKSLNIKLKHSPPNDPTSTPTCTNLGLMSYDQGGKCRHPAPQHLFSTCQHFSMLGASS